MQFVKTDPGAPDACPKCDGFQLEFQTGQRVAQPGQPAGWHCDDCGEDVLLSEYPPYTS